jgi:hypothetical protein
MPKYVLYYNILFLILGSLAVISSIFNWHLIFDPGVGKARSIITVISRWLGRTPARMFVFGLGAIMLYAFYSFYIGRFSYDKVTIQIINKRKSNLQNVHIQHNNPEAAVMIPEIKSNGFKQCKIDFAKAKNEDGVCQLQIEGQSDRKNQIHFGHFTKGKPDFFTVTITLTEDSFSIKALNGDYTEIKDFH